MNRMPKAVMLLAALILAWQLLVPPVVAMADNGDFGKLIGHFDLGAPSGPEYAHTRFVFDRRFGYESRVWSSDLALIVPALAINHVISKDGSFDIRVMGAVNAAVFLLALWLLVSAGARYWALGVAAIFIFCDALYAAYFNSFYMDAGALLFLLLGCAAYVRRMPVLLFFCAVLLAASKTQYAVMGLWLAVLFWWLGRRWMAGAVLAASLVTFAFSSPPDYAAKNAFNVIFTRLAPDSKDPDRTLAELGLDGSYRQWIGQNAYSPGSRLEDPAFYVPFMRRSGYTRIGIYYARHPLRMWRVLRRAMSEGARLRPPSGNFDARSGEPGREQSQAFDLWSSFERRLFEGHGTRWANWFLGICAAIGGLLWVERKSLPEGAIAGVAVFIGMAVTNMLVSGLADVLDPERHYLLFSAQFNVLLLVLVWLAGRRTIARG